MASNREERFLMRQRGAGTRQLRNSGFDFAIQGISDPPLKPLGSGRASRTPQSGSQPQSSSRRTPKVTPLLAQRSSRRTPASGNTKTLNSRSAAEAQSDEKQDATAGGRGSSTRKRKLATMFENVVQSTEEAGSQLPRPFQAVDSAPRTEPSPGGASVIAEGDNGGLEDSILSTERTGKKRKKRKSIGQNSRKRARTSMPVTDATDIFISPPSVSRANNQQHDVASEPAAEPDVLQEQTVPRPASESAAKVKRKKRKSIGKLPKVKRKSLTVASPSTQNVQATITTEGELSMQQENTSSVPRRKPQKVLAPVEEMSEDDFHEEPSSATRPGKQKQPADDDILPSAQTSRPGRPKKSDVSVTVPASKRASKPLTARSRAPGRTSRPRTSSPVPDSPVPDSPDRPPRKEKPGTIPITVHRLSRPQPTDHSSADEDILAAVNPFPKRSGVNAIDVLSQICRELVAKAAENLKSGEAKERGARKRVETRKRKAVELFGEELDARLFLMTEALDNNYALTIRLRQANKEKVARREELLEIKRLRAEVAIETDEVRARHERDSKVAQDELDLNTMIQDVELAVQRGRALQEVNGTQGTAGSEGLEVQLRTVAEKVASAGPGGGLLERVKGFNRMVERAIAVL